MLDLICCFDMICCLGAALSKDRNTNHSVFAVSKSMSQSCSAYARQIYFFPLPDDISQWMFTYYFIWINIFSNVDFLCCHIEY
jgi:hypothetical protein